MGQVARTKKKNDGNPSMGTTGWLWTVVLVSAAMFVLGVLVGRGTSPVSFDIDALQKELAVLKDQALEDESQRYRIEAGAGDRRADLEFHEALKTRRPRTETLPKKPKPAATVPAPSPAKPAVPKPAPPAPVPAGPVASPPAQDDGRPMTLQVASLKESAAADRMVRSLTAKGFSAYRVVADVPGKGRWYRVRVGTFKNADEAALILRKLKNEGRSPILVKRN